MPERYVPVFISEGRMQIQINGLAVVGLPLPPIFQNHSRVPLVRAGDAICHRLPVLITLMMLDLEKQQSARCIRKRLGAFGLPDAFRLTFDFPSSEYSVRRVLPFRRAWVAMAVIAAIDAAVMIPAMMTYRQAMVSWRSLDSLFDLTSAIFVSAWLIGWSVAPLVLSLILVLMLTGREVLIGRPGVLQLGIGVPGLILSTYFDLRKLANLRMIEPAAKSGTAWRGTHLSFDYDGRQVDFGSAMTQGEMLKIKREFDVLAHSAPQAAVNSSRPQEKAWRKPSPPHATLSAEETSAIPLTLSSPSMLALIASNLIPVFGAFFFGWRLADIMVLYWAESAVIGLFNVAKIAYVGRWTAIFTGIFFLAHFSAFMAGHFLFIYGIFIEGMQKSGGGDLKAVADLFTSLWPALAALFISHLISFVTNFLGKREYERKTVQQLMAAPYSRIVLMHVTLIFGGFITMLLHDPVPVLLLFILIKTLMDARAHMKEHNVNTSKGLLIKQANS